MLKVYHQKDPSPHFPLHCSSVSSVSVTSAPLQDIYYLFIN